MEFESKEGDSNFLPFLIRTYHDKFLPANFYIYVRETILIFKKKESLLYTIYITNIIIIITILKILKNLQIIPTIFLSFFPSREKFYFNLFKLV